jgi:outer membrane receptor protein involved in Fe transport
VLKGMRLAPFLLAGIPVAYAQQSPSTGLEEIIVTAQKREENLQAVPLSIQAIGTARLEELNVVDFEDYAKHMPSVSYVARPGSRRCTCAASCGGDGNHSGSLPSVGIYLDEQPITTIQGALDIHMYDIARVEALAGPQGTLYGASSQSGTLRIITNKPELGEFSAAYGLEGNTISGGDNGYLAEGYVNVPVRDNMAIRLVGWARHDAGYIDNVAGTRTFVGNGITADNSARANDDDNDIDTVGGRAALRIDLNESWTVTPTLMYQKQEANGSFADDPAVGEGKVTHFLPDLTEDRWTQAALTVEGKIGNFDIVYAGSYLDREVDSELDYSDYSYWYDVAYQEIRQGSGGAPRVRGLQLLELFLRRRRTQPSTFRSTSRAMTGTSGRPTSCVSARRRTTGSASWRGSSTRTLSTRSSSATSSITSLHRSRSPAGRTRSG